MISIESHAPSANFEAITTMSTTAVVMAPTRLIAIERRQPRTAASPLRPSTIQCLTIPLWDRVNDVNTPTT
jgi:hypothetical protein